MANDFVLKKNMRLFGLPYQFNESVDPRADAFSPTVGRKFAENIILDAPVVSIIPGKPKYLTDGKNTTTQALISAASENFSPIRQVIKEKIASDGEFRYYDFERAYTEYMKYVNILCRTCASFLEIDELIDGCSCQRYDYRKYRWTTENIHGNTASEKVIKSASSAFKNKISIGINHVKEKFGIGEVDVKLSDTLIDDNPTSPKLRYETTGINEYETDGSNIEELLTNYNFVQFFIDSDISFNESMTNQTSESMIKQSIINSSQNIMKEFSFIAGSTGAAEVGDFLTETTESISQGLADLTGKSTLLEPLSRVLSLAGNVASGENVIMPDIYQSSQYSKSYTFTVHLKTPYGTKFGYFMDICVPLMHLIGLGLPTQTSNANSYNTPFLVKAYCEGIFTCNLGIVESITIQKGVNSSYSVDGLPTEVDVSVNIVDLYSDLAMTPQSAPLLFTQNSSLIEYLATTCGLSLITPNLDKRWDMMTNSVINAFKDVGTNIISGITEAADNFFMDFLGLNNW